MLIIGINASPFTDINKHNCAKMLNTALKAAEATGAEVETINLGQVPHDDGRRDEEKYTLNERVDMLPAAIQGIVRAILRADGVIFVTPTRNFTASSRMLALLSWLQVTTDAPDYALAVDPARIGLAPVQCECTVLPLN
jgi:multimeric flavodoxin WrbA